MPTRLRQGLNTPLQAARQRRVAAMPIRASYDAVVVGLGAMGSSAVYHAAKSSLKVLGLEQFDVGHSFSSSHGHTRVFRVAHRSDAPYTELALRSAKLWEELEDDSSEKLLHQCGTLNIGSFAKRVEQKAKDLKIDHQMMTVQEMQTAYPGLRVEDESIPVLLDRLGGFLESDKILQTHIRLSKKMHADVRVGERMIRWTPDGSGVKVETDKGTYLTQTLILSSGPWILQHIPQLKDVCYAERQVIGWYDSKPSDLFSSDRLPCFLSNDGDKWYYGIPSHDRQGLKLGQFSHLKQRVDPGSVDRCVHPEDLSVLDRALRFMFQPEAHRLKETSVCLFTNAPEERFIIDGHPVHPQVLLCSACSGMGFKFSSAIGQMLTQLAIEDVDPDAQQMLNSFSLNHPTLNMTAFFE